MIDNISPETSITVISGTNRADSFTAQIAEFYFKELLSKGISTQFLDLKVHEPWKRDEAFIAMEDKFLRHATHLIFVLPEYNGSYPGVLKMLIDQSDVPHCWRHKKALLTGVSTGRQGNLRGLEHFTGSLMHMQMYVEPNRLPISVVHTLFDEQGNLNDQTSTVIKKQIEGFLNF